MTWGGVGGCFGIGYFLTGLWGFGALLGQLWLCIGSPQLVLGEFWPPFGLLLASFCASFGYFLAGLWGYLGLFWDNYGCILEVHN